MSAEFNHRKYGELLLNTLPQVIEDDAEHERLLAIIEPMFGRRDMSAEEIKLFNLLVKLIQDYEDKHHPIDDLEVEPHEMLRYLMEQRDLKQKDLVEIFGSQSRASEALNGVRPLSKTQIKALSDYFYVSADVFL
ncbi:MAG: transcriptional regulator [Acidobacteriota bacterium]|nr:MAG: transcriptional regulator [Acidobacteriota bacterium]